MFVQPNIDIHKWLSFHLKQLMYKYNIQEYSSYLRCWDIFSVTEIISSDIKVGYWQYLSIHLIYSVICTAIRTMAATQSPIIGNRNSPPPPPPLLILPPKPSALTNGASPTNPNDTKKLPPLPIKPKPPLSQRTSHFTQRVSAEGRFDMDSSPDTSPPPTLRAIPITKKLSLDSVIPMSTNPPSLLPFQVTISPTRSASNLYSQPPPLLKPKPTQSTPSSSPLPTPLGSSELASVPFRPRTDSPVVAPKPFLHITHNPPFSSGTPQSTPCSTNSEDSSPDKTLPELPPKLPVRPQKSHPEKSVNIIVVPRKEPRKQHWTTNASDLPPPLPDKLPSDDTTRNSSEGEPLEDRTKIYRTLPSRNTKKKRPHLLHHTELTGNKVVILTQ